MIDSEQDVAAAHYLEQQKLASDFVKHMTTLATGSIVLLATFLKDIFKHPRWTALIPLTFASLVISMIGLSFAALGLLQSVRYVREVPASVRSFTGISALAGMMFLLFALMLLSTFAIKNWT